MSTRRRDFVTCAGVTIASVAFALHLHAQKSEKPFHKPLPVLDTVSVEVRTPRKCPPLERFVPACCQRYVMVEALVAVTVNVAVPPALTF